MARRGFLGRIVDRVRQIVAPPTPPPREQPPEEQPREEPRAPTTRDYRDIWRGDHGKGKFNKNLDVFQRMMDDVRMPQDERLELWDTFVRNIVNGEGRYRRQSTFNPFWQESGIDPAAMDWSKWREAMGYTGKRRRQTA